MGMTSRTYNSIVVTVYKAKIDLLSFDIFLYMHCLKETEKYSFL